MLEGTIRRHGWPKFTLVVLDFVGVTLAAGATLLLHYYTTDEYDVQNSLGDYVLRVGLLWISFPVIILLFRQHLLYKYKVYSTGIAQFAQLSRALLINSLLLIALLFFLREDWIQHSRTNLLLFTISSLLILSFFRLVIFRKMLLPAITGIESRRILLVGAGEEARTLLAENISGRSAPFEIVALVDQNGMFSSDSTEAVVFTTVPLLKEFVPKYNIHEIIVAENDLPYEDVVRLIAEARETGVPIHLLSDHFKVIQERVTKSSSEFLNVAAAPVSHGVYGFYASYLKRIADIVGMLIATALLSPLLLFIIVAIKFGSRGPLFYSTEVIGQNGERFRWFKFRTMIAGGEDAPHRQHVAEHIKIGTRPTGKLENDPRITAIGRWLRRHSLDELPQLYNVLRGDMSLVGPRPCLPYEFDQYAPWHKERFTVRPGMTGLWQVSGRSSVSFNDMVILDLYYIHNISLWLDAAIALRTVGVVLTGKGGG